MLREIGLSEARRRLSSLLREIEADPALGYQIRVREKVVGELRSPLSDSPQVSSGEALLRAARRVEELSAGRKRRAQRDVASNYKEHLYGPAWETRSRRRR